MKVPMRFRIFDNSTVEGIRFDPQDKLGKYKIIAEIHDNVGEKKIALTKFLNFNTMENSKAVFKVGVNITRIVESC